MILSAEVRDGDLQLMLNPSVALKVLRTWMNRHLLSELARPKNRWAAQTLVALESALLSPGLSYTIAAREPRELWLTREKWLRWLVQESNVGLLRKQREGGEHAG